MRLSQFISVRLLTAAGVLLLGAAGAPAQELPGADLHWQVPSATEVSAPASKEALPDAPEVQPPTSGEKFRAFVDTGTSPLLLGGASLNAHLMRDAQPPGAQTSYLHFYGAAVAERESNAFFGKYLYPSLLKQDPRYHPSTSNNVFKRAAYAASRLVLTRNDAGATTVNTSYLLGVLTAAAVSTAYQPYWRRTNAETFVDFGSIIGTDAGMNLFHEFWPGIRRKLEGRGFVQKLEKIPGRLSGPSAKSE